MKETRHEKTTACYELERELQAFLEGENRPSVLAHTQECAFCKVIVEDLKALRAAALEMAYEEPSRAVWSNIRAQLAAAGAFRGKVSLRDWIGQLAFVHRPVPVAAFACLIFIGCLMTGPQKYPGQGSSSRFTASSARPLGPMAVMGESDALERVVTELEGTFRAREASLSPDLRATYDKSLKSLDASIQECSDSLQNQPGNSLTHEYLITAYSQKAEVLSSALQLDEGH
jgi:hypothetical protein